MMLFSRLLPPLSFGAVMLMTAFPAHSALQSGTVTFDNQTIHYQLFTGKDESYFQSFAAGATVTNFETSPAGVTPFQTNSYTNQNVGANNFVSPKSPIGDIYYSAGGQTPGDPAKASSTPFSTVLVELTGNTPGAHSGNLVLGPSDFEGTQVKLESGGFFSFGVQTLGSPEKALSRIGFWTNTQTTGEATIPNIHVMSSTGDVDNFLVQAGIVSANAKLPPGDFFALALDASIIQEVEFVPADHATIDDVVYARDKKVAFGVVPEPSSWLLLASGLGGLLLIRRKRA